MIASLNGVVQAIGSDHAVIEVQGVGYLVQASSRALANMQLGTACFLLVETQVREGAITLFGFPNPAERDWFRLLTTVQAVGGRLALGILGALTPDEIASAITLEDKAMLTRAPGVGQRIAARIITELKGKVPAFAGGIDNATLAALPDSATAPGNAPQDALSALQNLGFRSNEAARAVAEALRDLSEDAAAPALIREALKRINR